VKAERDEELGSLSGDQLVRALAALASPHRLRILAVLSGGRRYVSQLAREVRLSRPLVHMHLQRLQTAGLVSSHLELSTEGKAMRYYEVEPFVLRMTPERIAEAARTLTDRGRQIARPRRASD
jgi:DNA-binding transcriptional ArsR family regulator